VDNLVTPKSGRGMKRINSGGLVISNTHDANNNSIISIYKNRNLIAQETVTKRGGYKYLQKLTRSKHFKSLERQLMRHSITLSDIGLGKGVLPNTVIKQHEVLIK